MENAIGCTLPSMSLVISSYFFGIGAGSYIFAKLALKRRWLATVFIANQFVVLLCAIFFAFSHGLQFVNAIAAQEQNLYWLFLLFRILIFALFSFTSAFFLGSSFPLLNSHGSLNFLADRAEKLYLANTIG